MATYLNTDSMDLLLVDVRDSSSHIYLVENYTRGDAWATIEGNLLARAIIGPGDFDGPTDNTGNRQLNFLGATSPAAEADSEGAPNNYHGLLVDEDSETVYVATQETTNQPITEGNEIIFGGFTLEVLQPTQVTFRVPPQAGLHTSAMTIEQK